ncbi:L-lactate utilization operon repressor [Variovorax sp. SRS16]|nr:L-lactate utilization operon repressor [Variovorax sp. SRS16]
MPIDETNAPHRDLGYREPPDRKSMHSQIVRDVGIRIVAGSYKPGDLLPPEPSLCAAYEVSRSVLREATRVLVAKGLVISRQRTGVIVRPRSDWHLLDPDVLYWLIQTRPPAEFVETLLTVRRIFEPAAAALAAEVASAQGVQAIVEAYAGMEAAQTPEELLEPDLAFHRRIAQATGNDLLAYIGNMLSLALRESIKLSSRHPDTHALSLPRHKAILKAISNRNPRAARRAALVQLEATRKDLSEILDRDVDPA